MSRRQRHWNFRHVAGCGLLLDGRRGRFFDATSGGNAVVPGGEVARWEDGSGNGRHGTQAWGPARPVLQDGIAGTPRLVFNEWPLAQSLEFVNPFPAGPATWLVVVQTSDPVYLTVSHANAPFFDATDGLADVPHGLAGFPTYRVNGGAVAAMRPALRAARGTGAHVLVATNVQMTPLPMNLAGYSFGGNYALTGDVYVVAAFSPAPDLGVLRRMEQAMAARLRFSCA